MSTATTGIIRRTNTPEGGVRAIAVLDKLWADRREQEPVLMAQPAQSHSPIQFRRWDVETWEPLEEDTIRCRNSVP